MMGDVSNFLAFSEYLNFTHSSLFKNLGRVVLINLIYLFTWLGELSYFSDHILSRKVADYANDIKF